MRDPLYLYTDKSAKDHCLEYLRQILEPFLIYAAHAFGTPKGLDNNRSFVPSPHDKPKDIYGANLEYSQPISDSTNIDLFKTLFKDLCGFNVKCKSGTSCVIKVQLPALQSHAFWMSEREEDIFHEALFEGDRIVYEGKGWGFDDEAAKQSAARRAENIIHDLRLRLKLGQKQDYSSWH